MKKIGLSLVVTACLSSSVYAQGTQKECSRINPFYTRDKCSKSMRTFGEAMKDCTPQSIPHCIEGGCEFFKTINNSINNPEINQEKKDRLTISKSEQRQEFTYGYSPGHSSESWKALEAVCEAAKHPPEK